MEHESTVVFFVCAWCEASTGVMRVAWTGSETETTHGLCDGCLRRMRARRDDARRDPLSFGATQVAWHPRARDIARD